MGNAGAPFKKGIEYYSINMRDNTRKELLLEFGREAISIWLDLQDNIYDNEGYYAKWGTSELKRFAYNYRIDSAKHDEINSIVELLLHNGFFDQAMFDSHGILTSKDIQRFYFWVVRRRKMIEYNADLIYPEVVKFIEDILDKREKDKKKDKSEEDTEQFMPTGNGINVNINSNNEGDNKDNSIHKTDEKEALINNNADNNINNSQHESGKMNTETTELPDHNTTKNSKEKESIEKRSEASILNSSNSISKDIRNDYGGKTVKKTKSVHPARSSIISRWEETFEMVYTPSKDANIAINHIIKSMENNLKKRSVPEDQIVNEIINSWNKLLKKWDKLEPFYAKQVTFEAIAKHFVTIVTQLFPNHKKTSVSSASGNTSGGYD